MSNIKSLGQQSIHSTQSAPAEGPQKSSELVSKNKPAEFRPLSNEQKESIKQSRNAENKLAEASVKAFMFPPPNNETPAESHVNWHETESRMPEIFRKVAADSQVYANERKAWEIEHPADHHVLEHGIKSADEKAHRPFTTPEPDRLPMETGPLGKLPEFPELDRQLPMGTGPTGELPDLDDLKGGIKKIKKPIADVIRDKMKEDS
jgi:hypothetical protein